MCDAPPRGRGQPAIYSKEEAKLRKRERARLWAYRRVQQLPKAVAVPTVPTVLTVPTAPPVPEREPTPPIVEDDDSPHNPFLDDEDDAGGSSSSNNDGGGYTVDNSGGRHIDEDLYGVSDGEQEPQRLPKDRPDEPADLDYRDSPATSKLSYPPNKSESSFPSGLRCS
jgi:hypothetical protein